MGYRQHFEKSHDYFYINFTHCFYGKIYIKNFKDVFIMETTKTSLIQILWDGPYNITDLVKLKNEETDYGIYQIYGNHPIYGNDVLLYIGCFFPQKKGCLLQMWRNIENH
ncbi:hypothetical protein [Bacillus wiedmannii]|uniref:hypothetical protein n=1 Tax=Bacillus wiedmannii TaxID=1890302 RepID=UPI000992F999|nr:hypothetical protein [Bacillus wiedmannii]